MARALPLSPSITPHDPARLQSPLRDLESPVSLFPVMNEAEVPGCGSAHPGGIGVILATMPRHSKWTGPLARRSPLFTAVALKDSWRVEHSVCDSIADYLPRNAG